jgi:hypothetical protein
MSNKSCQQEREGFRLENTFQRLQLDLLTPVTQNCLDSLKMDAFSPKYSAISHSREHLSLPPCKARIYTRGTRYKVLVNEHELGIFTRITIEP